MQQKSIMALDVGEKRIGVALANSEVKMPNPLVTLANDTDFFKKLSKLIAQNNVTDLVVGLPRNLSGDDTAQTAYTRNFVDRLQEELNLPIHTIDEAGTSKQAEEELAERKKPYDKGEVDSLAACYILEDFLSSAAKTVQSGDNQ